MKKTNYFTKNLRTQLVILCACFFIQNAQAQLLNEGFEGASFPPTNWVIFDNGIGLSTPWSSDATNPHTGSKVAFMQYDENVADAGTNTEDWLVSPQITPTAGENSLSFYQALTYGSPAPTPTHYSIRVSTSSQTDTTTFTTIAAYDETSFTTAYSIKTVSLSAYIGQDIYIAFVKSQDNGDDWYVDDIFIATVCSGNPAASNTVSPLPNAFEGVPFNLSLSMTYAADFAYQWQSSPNGTTWSNLSTNAQSSTYDATQTVITYYQCIITCPNSGLSTTSTPVMVGVVPAYCTPIYSGVDEVNIEGVAFNTLSNLNTGPSAANFYTDYTAMSTSVVQGASYSLHISPDLVNGISATVWIDYDQNSVFDSVEQVFFHTNTLDEMIGNIVIPATATLGTTRMRVRGVYGLIAQDPCTSVINGETEDYNVIILQGTVCTGAPTLSNTLASSSSICLTEKADLSLSLSYPFIGITYQWQSSPNGTTWTNILGATGTNFQVSPTVLSFYQCIVSCTNSSENTISVPVQIDINAFSQCYCTPSYDSLNCITINTVNFGNIANTYWDCPISGDNYSDYTNLSTTVAKGGVYDISIMPDTINGTSATIWIDFNQNGIFETTEQVFFAANSTTLISGTIKIPGNAKLGTTRMRIRGVYGSTQAEDPCYAVVYGETEDYSVTIACTANTNISIPTTSGTHYATNSCQVGRWTYFYSDMDLLLALEMDTWTPGNLVQTSPLNANEYLVRVDVGNTLVKDLIAAPYNTVGQGWQVINRTWDVILHDTFQEPTAPINVKTYFSEAEFAEINNNFTVLADKLSSPSKLTVYKLNKTTPIWGGVYASSMDALNSNHAGLTRANLIFYNNQSNYEKPWIFTSGQPSTNFHTTLMSVDEFSGGGGGGGAGGSAPFPIELAYFQGESQGTSNLLNWATLSELSNKSFEVQRSLDGINYEKLGIIDSKAANGSSNALLSYQFTDKEPAKLTYYRLKQIDIDGNANIVPNIVEISLANDFETTINLFPNPTNSELNIAITSTENAPYFMEITDIYGKKLLSAEPISKGGTNISRLYVGNLAEGSYFLIVRNSKQQIITTKYFVKNL